MANDNTLSTTSLLGMKLSSLKTIYASPMVYDSGKVFFADTDRHLFVRFICTRLASRRRRSFNAVISYSLPDPTMFHFQFRAKLHHIKKTVDGDMLLRVINWL